MEYHVTVFRRIETENCPVRYNNVEHGTPLKLIAFKEVKNSQKTILSKFRMIAAFYPDVLFHGCLAHLPLYF